MEYTGNVAGGRRARRWLPRNRRRALVAGTTLFCLATGPGSAQAPASLASRLRSQAAEEKLLVWSEQERPGWKDFQGAPTVGTATAAQTSSGVSYLVQCRGRSLRFAVLATFSPRASWVRPDIPGHAVAGPQSLRHERTHFDITELFARRLRRELGGLGRVCPGREGEVRKVFDRLAEGSRGEQERYDRETAHGMARDAQARWERDVRKRLASLARYGSPIGRE